MMVQRRMVVSKHHSKGVLDHASTGRPCLHMGGEIMEETVMEENVGAFVRPVHPSRDLVMQQLLVTTYTNMRQEPSLPQPS